MPVGGERTRLPPPGVSCPQQCGIGGVPVAAAPPRFQGHFGDKGTKRLNHLPGSPPGEPEGTAPSPSAAPRLPAGCEGETPGPRPRAELQLPPRPSCAVCEGDSRPSLLDSFLPSLPPPPRATWRPARSSLRRGPQPSPPPLPSYPPTPLLRMRPRLLPIGRAAPSPTGPQRAAPPLARAAPSFEPAAASYWPHSSPAPSPRLQRSPRGELNPALLIGCAPRSRPLPPRFPALRPPQHHRSPGGWAPLSAPWASPPPPGTVVHLMSPLPHVAPWPGLPSAPPPPSQKPPGPRLFSVPHLNARESPPGPCQCPATPRCASCHLRHHRNALTRLLDLPQESPHACSATASFTPVIQTSGTENTI